MNMHDKDIKNAFAEIEPTAKQRERSFAQLKGVIAPICKINELIKCITIGILLVISIFLAGAGISIVGGSSMKDYIQKFFEFREVETVCYAEEMDR